MAVKQNPPAQPEPEESENPQNPSGIRAADDLPIADPSVASEEQNAALQHSQGGATTRDDKNDLGVPMLPGDPSEPQGPEDALGPGPTRGDYRNRIGADNYNPHSGATPQRPNAESIGDVPGKKGGVETTGEG